MALIDLGFNTRDERMHRDLERLLYHEAHGTHASYRGVNALKNSDVFTAVRIISADVASTNLVTKGHQKHDLIEKVLKMFNQNPDDELPGWHFKFIIIANMLLNGESFVEIVRDENGLPKQFHFLHNDLVGIEELDGEITYNVSEDVNGNAVQITPEDVLHFRYITLDGYIGYSPLYALAHEIGISQGSKGFLRNFFDNGGTSTAILQYRKGQINAEDLQQLKKDFSESQLKNNGGLVAIDDTMSFDRLRIPTEVLNFLNSYKFSTSQVAKAFGLPLSKLGIETVNTSITQANLEYLQSTLYPLFQMMIAEIDKKIISKIDEQYSMEFDASRLVDIDPELRLQRVTELHSKAIITTNEARDVFGYEPIQFGEQPIADLNKAPLSTLQDYQQAKIQKQADLTRIKGGGAYDE